MNFGKWIVVAFVLFAGFIGTLVTICVRQDITLVSRDYYKEELVYQDQISRIENAGLLEVKPEILFEGNRLKLVYDDLSQIEKGTLNLFRPSDSALDEQFDIAAGAQTSREFSLRNPAPGLYRARLTWLQHGKEYYMEKVIIL